MEALSISQIVAQTARIPFKSRKAAAVLLLTFLATTTLLHTSNLFVLFHDVRPLLGYLLHDILIIEDYTLGGPEAAAAVEAAESDAAKLSLQVVADQFLFWVVSYLISVCAWIVFVHFAEITHLGKKVSLRELLARAAASSRGAVVTCLFASLLTLVYACALVLLLGAILEALHGKSRVLLVAILLAVAAPAAVSVLFLSFLADVARVASVLEGLYGPAAFAEAWRILRERRAQGLLLALLLQAAAFAALEPLHLVAGAAAGRGWGLGLQVVLGYLMVAVMGLLSVFSMTAFAIFYLNCKRCAAEREAATGVELQFDRLIGVAVSSDEEEEEEEEEPLP